MRRLFLLGALLFALPAHANPITWHLDGVAFDDGGTANGSFVYDADTNIYSDVSVVTTAGSAFAGAAYNDSMWGVAIFVLLLPDARLPDLTGGVSPCGSSSTCP